MCIRDSQKCLKELKYSLTRQIWNKFTSTIKEPQMQGILQGFRAVSYTHLDVYKRQEERSMSWDKERIAQLQLPDLADDDPHPRLLLDCLLYTSRCV